MYVGANALQGQLYNAWFHNLREPKFCYELRCIALPHLLDVLGEHNLKVLCYKHRIHPTSLAHGTQG